METDTRELSYLAKLVIALAFGLVVAELLWHGVATLTIERLWRNLLGRTSGPMEFRFALQPAMAAIVAIKDGLADARTADSPFLQTIVTSPHARRAKLSEGLEATARIMLLGIVMDVVYQILALDTFYPLEALLIALLLAFIPYCILRGLVSRAVCRWRGPAARRG